MQGPPSGRHATLEGEHHPLKLNLSGQNTPTRPCQFKAPSVPPEGRLNGSWQGPPSGRHATLEGEYHPLKLNLSGQNTPNRPFQFKAPSVPPEGGYLVLFIVRTTLFYPAHGPFLSTHGLFLSCARSFFILRTVLFYPIHGSFFTLCTIVYPCHCSIDNMVILLALAVSLNM